MYHSKAMQEAVNYIYDNITADLSLDTLAEYVHFSPYHFHRMFLLCTGEAPMEYVRRLRLRKASQELLAVQSSIIEVALKYRFDSQDGFTRAFKKYYGITPGEYRKLNIKIGHSLSKKDSIKMYSIHLSGQSTISKYIEEEDAIMYDISIYEKLQCSHDEKYEALSTLDKILELSAKAKNSGLLSLEPEIDKVQTEFFKKSILMLIDGFEPDSLKSILLNYALCGGCNGKDLLTRIIIIEGILAIQEGINTIFIREKLSSYFGEDFISEINKHFCIDEESLKEKIDQYIVENQRNPTFTKETSLLDEPISRIDCRSLQRLLREIDIITLSNAISGSSGEIQARVLKHVSKRTADLLISEMKSLNTLSILDITESQKQILETMNVLRNQGDIII